MSASRYYINEGVITESDMKSHMGYFSDTLFIVLHKVLSKWQELFHTKKYERVREEHEGECK